MMRAMRKKGRQLWSILLAVCLMMSMIPATVWADEPLTGNETTLDVGLLTTLGSDITGSSWNYKINTKTLNITTGDETASFVLTGTNQGLQRIDASGVHLVLDGADIKADTASGKAVTAARLTVQNNGTLEARSTGGRGIETSGDVSINSGSTVTVITTGENYQSLFAEGAITIDNAAVTVNGKFTGIFSRGRLEITNGSVVESTTDGGTAISAQGDIVINGSEVIAESNSTAGTGIFGVGSVISITNGSTVVASGSQGINVNTGIDGGTTDLIIADSEVTATGGSSSGAGIMGPILSGTAVLTISGGTVKAVGPGANGGVTWYYGKVIITGGSVNTGTTKQPQNAINNPVYKTALTLQGVGEGQAVTGSVTPASGSYSLSGVKTDMDGKVYFWLPQGSAGVNLMAGGNTYSGSFTVAANNDNALVLDMTYFAGGGTSETDPYLIDTPAQLAQLAALVNAGNAAYNAAYYKLTAPLDLSSYGTGEGWTPIGTDAANPFQGYFDGNSQIISGLTINRTAANTGLFGYVKNGTVKDLSLTNVNIQGQSAVGCVAGVFVNSSSAVSGSIVNCSVTGSVSGTENVGGIVGTATQTTSYAGIQRCYVTGTVAGITKVGGIAGSIQHAATSSIEQCYVTASVEASGDRTGGIVGYISNGTVKNCYTTGNVSGASSVGGIAGYVYPGSVQACYAMGAVSGSTSSGNGIGGVVGDSVASAEIKDCTALNPSVAGFSSVGRVIGDIGHTNNYAFVGMSVTRGGATASNVVGTAVMSDGASTAAATLRTALFWSTAMGWDSSIWTLADNQAPTLTGLAGQSSVFGAHLKMTPTAADLQFAIPTSHTEMGAPQGIGSVTAKAGISGLGTITVKYNGTPDAPSAAGAYAVTADIGEGTAYQAVAGLSLGSYIIGPAPSYDYTIDLGSINPSATAGTNGYVVDNSRIVISQPKNYLITGSTSAYSLETEGDGVNLSLNDISISNASTNALMIGGNTILNLRGENTLTGGGIFFGIFGASDASNKTLTINGPGTLNANGAGLSVSGPTQLTVNSGVLNTRLFAEKITINGGTVNAVTTGAYAGLEAVTSITITGGSVKAQGVSMAASPRPKNSSDEAVYMTTLAGLPPNSTVTALTFPSGYGYEGMKTDGAGKLYLWLPAGVRQVALEIGSTTVNDTFNIADNDNNLFAAGEIAVSAATGAELKEALQGTLPSTVTLTDNFTLTEAIGVIYTGASHTLVIPAGTSLTISSTAGITVGAGQTLKVTGGGTLNIAKASGNGVRGDGVLNLENITVNLGNTEAYGLNVKTVNVNQNAAVNLSSATGGALIHITYGGSLNVNSGGVIRVEDFTDVGILNAGGALNIAGGAVFIGRGRGDNVGIYSYRALIQGGTAYSSISLSAGTLTAGDGGRIYLLAQSQVEGMAGGLMDRGAVLSEPGVVTVGMSSLPPSPSALAEGYYTWNGALFNRQLITINEQSPEEVPVTQGGISASLSVEAAAGPSSVQYQWYQWSESANDYVAISGKTGGTFAIPAGLTATGGYQGSGEYYYACEITAEGYEPALIKFRVTVNPASSPSLYTVTFDGNGGSVSPASAQTGTDGKLTGGLPLPLRNDYSFKGWFTAASGGTEVTPDRVYTDHMTIYAQWNYTGGNNNPSVPGGNSNPETGKYVPEKNIVSGTDRVEVTFTSNTSTLSSTQMSRLAEQNQSRPVTLIGSGYIITFPAGSLEKGTVSQDYDLGVTFNQGENLKAIQEQGGSKLLLMVDFKYSGALPGQAEIRFLIGKEHAGEKLDYYYYNPQTGKLEYLQSTVVEQDGYVTVTQSHCSQYAFLKAEESEEPGTPEPGTPDPGTPEPGTQEPTPVIPERVYGETRYDTAVAIAKASFANGAKTVILARGDVAADALPAVPLAKYYDAPLLLTLPDYLPDNVLAEIKALGAQKVIIVGGPGAVKAAVEERLKGSGITVERIYGQTHYDTAYEIAKRMGSSSGEAVLVNGDKYKSTYADALSISAWAGYHGVPILYVDSSRKDLPQGTAKALKELGISRTILIGGTAVIPVRLENLVPQPTRYGGETLYDTNAAVLENLQPAGAYIYAVTGKDFADALAGAAVAARNNGWLVLTGGGSSGGALTVAQEKLLRGSQEAVKEFKVFGGPAVVPETTMERIEAILGL